MVQQVEEEQEKKVVVVITLQVLAEQVYSFMVLLPSWSSFTSLI